MNDGKEEKKRMSEQSRVESALSEAASPGDRHDDSCLVPLVIPVSVPVRSTNQKGDGESQKNLSSERDLSESKSTPLTTRKRRLSRGSGGGPSIQVKYHL